MIRTLTVVAGAALLLAACGQQVDEQAADNTNGPAVAASTEGNQAVDMTPTQDAASLAAAGYMVSGPLTQDANGVWMGTATREGAEAMVGIDYKGAITQPAAN